ncbi:MAG: response regulator [bacterium]
MARVMIVEDEDSLRETLSRYLTHEGHEVISTGSGYEALEAGIDAAPDVLVADWMLKSQIHGLHVSEVFRALHPRLHTILITGFSSRDLLEESDRQGVLRLLEKPFDLRELQEAVALAASDSSLRGEAGPPIAAMALGLEGEIHFASAATQALLERAGIQPGAKRLQEVLGETVTERLRDAESDWVEVRPVADPARSWLMRTRRRAGRIGWLAVLCPREDEARRSDPRMRLLLEARARPQRSTTADPGPVIVIERDGVVRRLLVSQVERIGALCYPSDDLANALRLLAAEPRVETVLIDFSLAGDAIADWVGQIRAIRPEARVVGMGGVGAETDLLAVGVSRVLRKPWRIMDLAGALTR